jgi:hypothetical protein
MVNSHVALLVPRDFTNMGFLIIWVGGSFIGWMLVEAVIGLVQAGRFAFSSVLAFITVVLGTWLVHNYVPFWITGTALVIMLFLSVIKRLGSFT